MKLVKFSGVDDDPLVVVICQYEPSGGMSYYCSLSSVTRTSVPENLELQEPLGYSTQDLPSIIQGRPKF